MKALVIAFLTTLTLQARAGAPLPAIDPMPVSALPVIQLSIGGGMPVPGGLAQVTITVLASGSVHRHEVYFSKDWNNPAPVRDERDYELPSLSHRDMKIIAKNAAQLSGGEFREDNQPQCMDAPSSHYAVYKNFQWVNVYQIIGCIHHELLDQKQTTHARTIKNILDDLYSNSPQH